MRLSGVLLALLGLLHFADLWLVDDIADASAFSRSLRWDDWWWRLSDLAFFVLAVPHGLIGLHWFLERRVKSETVRTVVLGLAAAFFAVLFLGATWTVFAYS
jgi:succinate dehydrogenase hydrophobic anchor subunit